MVKIKIILVCLLICFTGCGVKSKYVVQNSQGIEVGLSQDSANVYRLIDNRGRVIASSRSRDKKITFKVPPYLGTNGCYNVVDNKREFLLGKSEGIKITAVQEYSQKTARLTVAKRDFNQRVRYENTYRNNFLRAKTNLNRNKLFNGRTCDLPRQKQVPRRPKTVCGSYAQCKKLANDSCMKNLVDAETCSAALSKSNFHESINSVSCGALVSSLNGSKYGISDGVQDALTGYLDRHTKKMIDEGKYGEAIGTGIIRVAITYYRTQSCKDNFTKAAYAPLARWERTRKRILDEPYVLRNQCNNLINNFNSSMEREERNKKQLAKLKKEVEALESWVKTEGAKSSKPESCRFY
ncbi:MAG: hypothetical protein OQK51_25430 [Kangiellaceae bacterium]|nr:hypothetical protein [Kangiellaceae bacterium]